MEAGKRNLTDIFNRARSLEVPFFQRSYVWKEENWERFLKDMITVADDARSYFLGSVILKQRSTDSSAAIGDTRVVVDGQQRLTTSILFFKVLYDARNDPGSFRETFFNFGKDVCLKHNHNDVEIFEAIVRDQLNDGLRAKYERNQILRAYDFFRDNASKLEKIHPPVLFSRVYFVGIDLSADEDEQQIFDTINSLGVSLTTAELLKNELFRRADLDLYNATWKSTFEADEEARDYWSQQVTSGRARRENIDLLLQSFLLIRSGATDKYSRVDNLFESFKSFLGEKLPDKHELVEDLRTTAELYRQSLRVDMLSEDIDGDDPVARLNVIVWGLSTTTVIPYILYVLKEVGDEAERDRMFRVLETFLMRRLICRETTKNYNNVFASLIRGKVVGYDALVKRLQQPGDGGATIPNDAALAQGFETSNLTNQQARVVLYLIEKGVRDETKYSVTPVKFSAYSLEHVMPKKWRNNWPAAATPELAAERDQLLLKLGNLTLITASLNSAIRDADWTTKKRGKGNRQGLKKYAQGLEIFGEDLEQATWDEERIRARSARLLDHAKRVWPLPA